MVPRTELSLLGASPAPPNTAVDKGIPSAAAQPFPAAAFAVPPRCCQSQAVVIPLHLCRGQGTAAPRSPWKAGPGRRCLAVLSSP